MSGEKNSDYFCWVIASQVILLQSCIKKAAISHVHYSFAYVEINDTSLHVLLQKIMLTDSSIGAKLRSSWTSKQIVDCKAESISRLQNGPNTKWLHEQCHILPAQLENRHAS